MHVNVWMWPKTGVVCGNGVISLYLYFCIFVFLLFRTAPAGPPGVWEWSDLSEPQGSVPRGVQCAQGAQCASVCHSVP